MNNFGDMFLKDEQEGVYLLNIASANLTKVANSTAELQQMISSKENQLRWFHTDLLTQLEQAGLALLPGQCFCVKKPLVLGGTWELSNIEVGPIVVHVSLMGQIHQQVQNLPPGTKIKGFTIG